MTWLFEERRQRRSSDRFLALRYQLEHARERGGIEALVLSDEEGIIVASSGDASTCAELGAIAPLMAKSVMGMPMPPLLRGAEVAIRPLEIYGQSLYLASVGGGVARDAHLSTSRAGVKRILVSN